MHLNKMKIKPLPTTTTLGDTTGSSSKGLVLHGKKEIHRNIIGKGRYGTVYKVSFPNQAPVALKEIRRDDYATVSNENEITIRATRPMRPTDLKVWRNNVPISVRVTAHHPHTLVIQFSSLLWKEDPEYRLQHPVFRDLFIRRDHIQDEEFSEVNVVNTLNAPYMRILRLPPCNMIPAIVAYEEEFVVGIVMQLMDGSLNEEELSIRDSIVVCEYLAQMAKCLLQRGYYYTDIKTANILYQKAGDTMYIALGDYGSLTKSNEGSLELYPHPIMYNPYYSREEDIAWGIWMMLLKLIMAQHKMEVSNLNALTYTIFRNKVKDEDTFKKLQSLYMQTYQPIMENLRNKLSKRLFHMVATISNKLLTLKIRTVADIKNAMSTLYVNMTIWNEY